MGTSGEIIRGLSFEEYKKIDALNNSGITEMIRSPLHYWDKYLNPDREADEPSEAMQLGTRVHAMALEPDLFHLKYFVTPSDAPKYPTEKQWNAKKPGEDSVAAMEYWKKMNAEIGEREVLTAAQFKKIQVICTRIKANPAIAAIFEKGEPEVTMVAKCPLTGVMLKIRIDWLSPGIPFDLKTTADAKPEEFAWSIKNYGYARQDYFYSYVYELVLGKKPDLFLFGAFETKSPWANSVGRVDEKMRNFAKAEVQTQILRYAECKKTNVWPGYSDSIVTYALTNGAAEKRIEPESY